MEREMVLAWTGVDGALVAVWWIWKNGDVALVPEMEWIRRERDVKMMQPACGGRWCLWW